MPWMPAAHIPPLLDSPVELRIRKALGVPMAAMRIVAWVPWMAEAHARFGMALPSRLNPQFGALIGLVVSQDNSCRHCYGTTRAMLRIMGLSDRVIRKIEADLHTGPLSDRELAGLEFARRVSRATPRVGPADLEALQGAGFTAS